MNERETNQEKIVLLGELGNIMAEKGWGRTENGRIIPSKREPEAMTGMAAKEFAEQSAESAEKYDYIVTYLKQLIKKFNIENPYFIDMGSGPGILDEKIAKAIPTAYVKGVDLSDDMIEVAQANIEKAGLQDRVEFQKADATKVHAVLDKKADIVVSRNMLHREVDTEQALRVLVEAAKDQGGITVVVAFLNPADFSLPGLRKFIADIKDRENRPNLQKAYALAFLNAPTLEQYKEATENVANQIRAEYSSVNADERNYVNIYIKKFDASNSSGLAAVEKPGLEI